MEDADIELSKLRKDTRDGRQDFEEHCRSNGPHLPIVSSDEQIAPARSEGDGTFTTGGATGDALELPNEELSQDRARASTPNHFTLWHRIRFVHVIDATSGDIRDHLALERTWLAYNRTANTLASYAVVVAQLLILHEDKRRLGRVCGIVMICGSVAIEMIAALRYLQQSHALVKKDAATGKSRAVLGSLSLILCATIISGISLGLFVSIILV